MNNLATLFRAAQFYAHNAHNLASGDEFFQDHKFFGAAYEAYTEAYDSIVERMIGLGVAVDLPLISKNAANLVAESGKHVDNKECFQSLFGLERAICAAIKTEVPNASDGTQNMLQGLADESEMRQYKIQQRLKP